MQKYITTPAPLTGIGWYAVKRWSNRHQAYEHVSTFRGEQQAADFIQLVIAREARHTC